MSATPTSPPPVPGTPERVVLLPLHGKHGEGRAATLDAEDHARLHVLTAGPWSLISNGKGRFYVASRYGIDGSDTVILARWVVGAGRGDVVAYLDGNPLNLRRKNLRLLRGDDLALYRREQVGVFPPPKPAATPHHAPALIA